MLRQTITALTKAFELMGPDRVADGLKADRSNWRECFLSRAYPAADLGQVYGLSNSINPHAWVSSRTGLPYKLVAFVAYAFDHHRSELQALAREWLEVTNAARTPTCSNSSRRGRQTVPNSRLVAAR